MGGAYYAVRIEPVCNVIKEVLGLNFKPSEIQTAIEFVDWASYSRGYFYDVMVNPWPIAKTIIMDETQSMHTVPLPECELMQSTLSRSRCAFIKQYNFDKIISDVERGSKLPHDPKLVVISSANSRFNDGQPYCFYETVTGKGAFGWFGWRFAGQCTFSDFCFNNVVNIGGHTTELQINYALDTYNQQCGFPCISDCYQPTFIYKYFKDYIIDADPERLPPCFKWDPFGYKNDEMCLYSMPKIFFTENDAETLPPDSPYGSPTSQHPTGVSAMAEGVGASANGGEYPGSTPLSDSSNRRASVANSPIGAPRGGPKRRRIDNSLIADEAENDDDDDDEEVSF
jgi:hypothetical protein